MTQALAPCGECNVGECDRCPTCRRFEELATARATERGLANLLGRTIPEVERATAVWAALEAHPAFVAGMERGQADLEAGRFTPYRHIRARVEGSTSFADVWQHRDDMRRDPGYALENVVPVDADMAQAMQAWVESMRWLGEDVA